MRRTTNHCPLFLAFVIFLLSTVAFVVNRVAFHFPGNNYYPPGSLHIGFILALSLAGVRLLWEKDSMFSRLILELNYFFWVLAIITLATNAVQYTPFPPIDTFLISIEKRLSINMAKIVAWTANHPSLRKLLVFSYDSLVYQMAYVPLLFILTRRYDSLHEFYCLLLLSVLIGFLFYYFFPTVAPASMVKSPYFSIFQHATGIKFDEIHQYIPPSTLEGGLIAMPSFHAIWAWLCLYLVRQFYLLAFLLLPLNVLLTASCVLLGWHYVLDLMGSLIVIILTFSIYRSLKKSKIV